MINKSFQKSLFKFLAFPSISANEKYKKDIMATAEWLKGYLVANGSPHTQIIETEGNPIVYSHYLINKNLPTLLFYGHYDVQPSGKIDNWESDPFIPKIRDGKIYARGAVDDKGQVMAFLEAFKEILKTDNLAFNIKILLEGEEEIGSSSITQLLTENPEPFKTDYILVADTAMIDAENPAITYGLRGYIGFELKLRNAKRDIHSGVYGGIVDNPINVLCEVLSSLKEQKYQRITIPGFYDNVVEINENEKYNIQQLPITEKRYLEGIGVNRLTFEKDYSFLEGATTRPTLDVNGIFGGYTEEGNKTIIPESATAKISMRLVENQIPEDIYQLTLRFIRKIVPSHIKVDVIPFGSAFPVVMNTNSDIFRLVENAVQEVYGRKPHYVRDGGSIPIITTMKKQLNAECVLLGFGLTEDNLHAPNESMGLDRLENAYLVFKNLLST